MSEGLILIVDDEERIQELVSLYLTKEGFTVAQAMDGEDAIEKARNLSPKLVILDIMLPKKDGWEVCREIRKTSSVPIIMLTAKGEEFDRVLGLELGADDYISKPFSPRELVARVRAMLRRLSIEESNKPENTGDTINYPSLFIDRSTREVKHNDKLITLTPKEFDLLWHLALNPGKVFTREQLLSSVWDYDYFGDLRTVDTHVKRLREKLDSENTTKFQVKTVWGVGYKFEVEK